MLRARPTSEAERVIPLADTSAGVTFAVRVVPRAGRTAIAGTRGDALLIRLAAAPVDGAANEALVACLAAALDRPRRDVTIVSGQTSRDKRIAVARMSAALVTARLSAILRETPEST
jgi:uncharacterized protein (TIGR00251 family)